MQKKRKQRDETTVAYITFALSQDAVKALETLQNTKIGDNRINIKFSKARSGQAREGAEGEGGGGAGTVEDKYARFRKAAENPNFQALGGVTKEKPKPIKKKSRLIVRNLSFKVTEEKMKEYFEQCGEVKEVNILKKSNGKLVGCAFIQYSNVPQAAKAVKELNLKPFLGRPIAIDWALPKEKYQTEDEKNKKKEEKVEETEEDTIVIKDEPADVETQDEDGGALDHYDDLKEVEEIKQESEDKKAKRKRKLDDDDDDDEDDSDSDDAEQKYSPQKRQKQISNDVEEGKTLFLRNLSFDTSEELLKQFFGKYGQLHYALLCKDSLTEHPKGTGFVKFKSSADKCLLDHNVDPTNFKLSGRQFNISVALSRDKVGKKTPAEIKSEKPKSDTRNLYLVREGPGSGAAVDVSASDMDKRASLNSVKKQMLKNLSIFISPTRLCVHNLPENYSDTQLRKLFKKFAGPGAVITEARVMRDMKNIQLDGKGKSKGFGFVNFKDHEHALVALRAVNNNPTVFKPTNRPIVEFSLENRSALKAKERRAQKSQEKNPNVKKQPKPEKMEIDEEVEDDDDDDKGNSSEEEEKVPVKQSGKKNQGKQIQAKVESDEEGSERPPNYAGLVAKKGVQSVPSFKPKGKITRNSLKTRKTKKKVQDRKKREAQVPSKRPIERIDKTEKIINRYQQKLSASSKSEGMKKKKWFDK
ncbi:RNA-binding protein 28 [Orchesella cincta]|uniref:RNA-binding protein 28 n=1 Tax=Orchesella cincta TaxID=48709 RepID=A0A1D2N1V1_ORCCI|nr:RNA-binding protein 28 [Orchesella cincta]